VRSRFGRALLALAGLYAALGVVPLSWTFGSALYERGSDLGDLVLSRTAWAALSHSVALGLGGALGTFVLALPLACLTGRTNVPAGTWLSALALVPLALPPYNMALALQPFLPASPLLAVSLVVALALYPVTFVFLRAGLASVDPALEEAGLLARGPWATFVGITWPLVRPWAMAAFGIVFLLGLGEHGAPALLGLAVYPEFITLRFAATYDANGAAIAALPLLGAVLLLLGAETAATRRAFAYAGRLRSGATIGLRRLPAAPAAIGFAVVLVSPGLPLIVSAVRVDQEGLVRALALAGRPALNSLLVAVGGCLLALVAASALALLQRRGFRKWRVLPFTFFVVPGAILGIGLIGFWNHPWMPPLYGSLLMLVFAMLVRYTVLVERALDAGLRSIPATEEEAARLAGRSESEIAFGILLPRVATALGVGAISFSLFALRDLDTVVTIYPPGGETLPVRLYTVLANSPRGLQAALSLAQASLTLPLLLILIVFLRKNRWLS
jgi:iron(III) transport system permease protein